MELADGDASGCRTESGLIEDVNKKDGLAALLFHCRSRCQFQIFPYSCYRELRWAASVFLVLRVSTLFRIPTTVLLLMDLLYYAETDTDADRICIEFPSRNATLCEEVEIAINPDNLAQQLLFFLTEGLGSQYIPEKLIREGVIVVTLS